MSTLTTRLALVKATDPEAVDVSILNANFDQIDYTSGAILVNPGVTPPNTALFDGAVIKERGSQGRVWVAEKNGGGGYFKYYIVADPPVMLQDPNPGGGIIAAVGSATTIATHTTPASPFGQILNYDFAGFVSAGGSAADLAGLSIRRNGGAIIREIRGLCNNQNSISGAVTESFPAGTGIQTVQLVAQKYAGTASTTFYGAGTALTYLQTTVQYTVI